jgi:hypothetical protein
MNTLELLVLLLLCCSGVFAATPGNDSPVSFAMTEKDETASSTSSTMKPGKRLSEATTLSEREKWLLNLQARMFQAQREYAAKKLGK